MTTQKILLFFSLMFTIGYCFSQQLDSEKLDRYFESLEKRNEAMASITISKQGNILYSKAIGYRSITTDKKISSDSSTKYRIWSITKLYTAVMIMQLIEEGKLHLDTKLMEFYPEITNANHITIRNMLTHSSGIGEFRLDESKKIDALGNKFMTPKYMVNMIAQYPSDFDPGTKVQYCNSNYLLLGYIIEALDQGLYGRSLRNRITSRLGLRNTYFGVGVLDTIPNKAHSYTFNKGWEAVDEGEFSGLIPAGAGGIVATTMDMMLFIEGLFSGELVSKESLTAMLPEDNDYGYGIMSTFFQEHLGYGHTGGYKASESSLFYYPEEDLTISYATNGIVIRKEEILNNVLKVYHDQAFDISMNRRSQLLLIFGIGLLLFLLLRFAFKVRLKPDKLLYLGSGIPLIFWLGSFIAGYLYGGHNPIKDSLTNLDTFYSASGSFMTGVQMVVAFLFFPFLFGLLKISTELKLAKGPLFFLGILPMALIGTSLFPAPGLAYQILINAFLFVILGPLLALFVWRRKEFSKLRRLSLVCLIIMLLPILFIVLRPTYPEFVYTYWGLIQRTFYLGWTLWLCVLGMQLLTLFKLNRQEHFEFN